MSHQLVVPSSHKPIIINSENILVNAVFCRLGNSEQFKMIDREGAGEEEQSTANVNYINLIC